MGIFTFLGRLVLSILYFFGSMIVTFIKNSRKHYHRHNSELNWIVGEVEDLQCHIYTSERLSFSEIGFRLGVALSKEKHVYTHGRNFSSIDAILMALA